MTIPDQAKSLILTPRPRRSTARWVTVTGGKGGVGKTLIAVNLAILTARSGYRTLLVDLDPGLGNVDVHVRLAPRHSIEDLADGLCSPSEAIVEGPGEIAVLAGHSGSTRLAGGDPEFLDRVLERVREAARDYDVVICDTGAGIGPSVQLAARQADLALVVTSPDPAAVTDAYALCKILIKRDITSPQLLVNRASSRDEAMRVAAKLGSVSEKFLDHAVPMIGWLRDDPMVALSVTDQRPFGLAGVGAAIEDLRAVTASALSVLPRVTRGSKRARANRRRDSRDVMARLARPGRV